MLKLNPKKVININKNDEFIKECWEETSQSLDLNYFDSSSQSDIISNTIEDKNTSQSEDKNNQLEFS